MPAWEADGRQTDPGMRLVDVTSASGLQFRHRNGAYGGKLLPETMGAGCAFLDYDADGWQDILFVNGMDWPGHQKERSTLAALPQQPQRNLLGRDEERRARRRALRHGRRRRRLEQRRLPGSARSRASARTVCSAIPARGRSSTSRRRAGLADGPPSAPRPSGSISIATACSISSSATTSSGRPSTTSSAPPTASRSRIARPRPTAATPAGSFATAATGPSRT